MQAFLLCVLCGFAAQLIDGTLGMAYGVSAGTLLRAMGYSSAMASFCTHTAEIFTTFASGISHFTMKNVDKKLFLRLILPGIAGGMFGAYILTGADDRFLSPLVSLYLILMGTIILMKAFRKSSQKKHTVGKGIYPLAFIGGFSDSIGSGGWGPIVTSTLAAADCDFRKTVGSVNAAEFFVTLAESTAFFLALGSSFGTMLPALAGLILGGAAASPIAAVLCGKVPVRPLMIFTGLLIITLNIVKLFPLFAGIL